MPSKTRKQARLMAAKCHNPGKVKSKGLSRKVACEFNRADKGTGILRMMKRKGKRA